VSSGREEVEIVYETVNEKVHRVLSGSDLALEEN
jgi:hypothetical protein